MVFIVDNTGSMGPYIRVTKQKILEIIRTITKEEMCERLRVGLICYRDHPPQDNSFLTRVFDLTENTSNIEKNILEMGADGGGDGPEAVADGLAKALDINWDRDAAKVAILIGDAPPHGVEEGDVWDKCPDGHIWQDDIKKAFDAGIVIHTVGCYPEIETGYKNAVATFKRIAAETKGQFFALDDATALVELITGIAVEEIDKLAIQESILSELGASIDSISEDDLAEVDIAVIRESLAKSGAKRRVVRASRAPSPSATQDVQVVEEEISEDDIREAIRQIRKKL